MNTTKVLFTQFSYDNNLISTDHTNFQSLVFGWIFTCCKLLSFFRMEISQKSVNVIYRCIKLSLIIYPFYSLYKKCMSVKKKWHSSYSISKGNGWGFDSQFTLFHSQTASFRRSRCWKTVQWFQHTIVYEHMPYSFWSVFDIPF